MVRFLLFLLTLCLISFVTAQNDAAGSVVSVILYNAETDEVVGELQEGMTIDFSNIGTTDISLVALTEPATVGSVRFALGDEVIATESNAPYAIAGDSDGGRNFNAWQVAPGEYVLTVTPYSSSGGNGAAGSALTLSFSVIEETAPVVVEAEPEGTEEAAPVETAATEPEMPAELSVSGRSRFSLMPVGDSGVDGSVLVTDLGSRTSLVILVRGTREDQSYVSNLYSRSCEGSPVAPLEGVSGKSGLGVTLSDLSYNELVGQNLYVGVTDAGPGSVISCGQLITQD